MTDWRRPGAQPGDEPATATAEEEEVATPAADLHALEAGEVAPEDNGVDDEVVRVRHRARPDTVVLLLAGILVVVVAQLLLGWFAYGAASQGRDQVTLANGLQRCLIDAQLNHNPTTDTTGAIYKAAVQSCLNK